jgi:copper chaperone NosL
MTIMEPQFGAEIITNKGRIFKFDDLHCVVNYIKKDKIKQGDIKQTLFIDYHNNGSFVDAGNAFFVSSPQLKSPMNSNTAAFLTREAADKKAAEVSGTVKDWSAIQQQP